jgi:hypothetical protein
MLCAYVLAATMVLHVLSLLFTHWAVGFNAAVNYRPVEQLADAEYVQVRVFACDLRFMCVAARAGGEAE